VQHDLLARKARGSDVAFDHFFEYRLAGVLPDGAKNTARARIADVVGCVTMKGIVLGERYHEKDSYDLYSVIAYYHGGPSSAAETVKPYLQNALVREAVQTIAEKFETIGSVGPVGVGRFIASDAAERERITADAYVTVRQFLDALAK
jgi:hypothetical protein